MGDPKERFTINIVVAVLGVLATISVAAIAYISVANTASGGEEVKIPQALIALASGLVGALGSMLVRTSSSTPAESMPVNVVNAPDNPVPTTEAASDPTAALPSLHDDPMDAEIGAGED